jgi:5-keto-L-gluconate epimerase
VKLAYTVGTPDTKGKMLAYCGRHQEIFSALRQIGYQGVELFVRDPRDMDQDNFCRTVESCGLEVAAVGTGPLVSEDKLTFTSPDDRVRIKAIERTKAVIDFAARFGAQVNVGKLRGNVHNGDLAQSQQWQNQAFRELCGYAAVKGVNITIEPQNRFAIDNLNTTQQAIAWITEQRLPNLFLMLDVFHMNIEDQSTVASIIEAKEYNIHVHFADNNRGVPGVGHINFPEVVRVLRAIGYNRYISVEIDQIPDSYRAAQASFEFVQRLIEECNAPR